MGNEVVLATVAGSALISLYLSIRVWEGRRKITCMTGMMEGLIAGIAVSEMTEGRLWPATLVGAGVGIASGVMVGAPISLMALLDGGMSGLMGGMMGAMLGVMAPAEIPTICAILGASTWERHFACT